MAEMGISTHIFDEVVEHVTRDGMTPFYGAIDGEIAGIFGLRDELKPHAQQTITALVKLGIKPAMITGDNAKTAAFIAKALNIHHVLAQTLPQEKMAAIRQFQSLSQQTQIKQSQVKQTGQRQLVAFVGDGINDAPGCCRYRGDTGPVAAMWPLKVPMSCSLMPSSMPSSSHEQPLPISSRIYFGHFSTILLLFR